MMRGGAVVARQAHNLKAVGSIPAPATNNYSASHLTGFFSLLQRKKTTGRAGMLPDSFSFKSLKK